MGETDKTLNKLLDDVEVRLEELNDTKELNDDAYLECSNYLNAIREIVGRKRRRVSG